MDMTDHEHSEDDHTTERDEGSEITIQGYAIVCRTPKWLISSKNVAVATAVTEDGRVVEGLGVSLWSTDTAAERAIEHARSMAAEVPFSFRITKVRVGASNATFQRVDEATFRKGGGGIGGNHPFAPSSKVWIRAEEGSHEVDASGKAYIYFGQVRRALNSALDSAKSHLGGLEGLSDQH